MIPKEIRQELTGDALDRFKARMLKEFGVEVEVKVFDLLWGPAKGL